MCMYVLESWERLKNKLIAVIGGYSCIYSLKYSILRAVSNGKGTAGLDGNSSFCSPKGIFVSFRVCLFMVF